MRGRRVGEASNPGPTGTAEAASSSEVTTRSGGRRPGDDAPAARAQRRRLTLVEAVPSVGSVGATAIDEESEAETVPEPPLPLGPLRCPICVPFSTRGPLRSL